MRVARDHLGDGPKSNTRRKDRHDKPAFGVKDHRQDDVTVMHGVAFTSTRKTRLKLAQFADDLRHDLAKVVDRQVEAEAFTGPGDGVGLGTGGLSSADDSDVFLVRSLANVLRRVLR